MLFFYIYIFLQLIIFNFNKNIYLNSLQTIFLYIFYRRLNAINRSIIRANNSFICAKKTEFKLDRSMFL